MRAVTALLLGGLALTPAGLPAQTIMGSVVEDGSRVPVEGVVVELVTADGASVARAETEAAGAFVVRAPRSGSYSLRASHPGYATLLTDPVSVGPDETVELELRIAPAAIPLEPLVVRARANTRLSGFYERREQPGFGRFIVRSEIERRPAARTTELLRRLPEVHIVRRGTASGQEDSLITMRLGQCVPVIYIDGIRVRQGMGAGIDRMLSPQTLEGVEVYSGSAGLPPQFVSDGCGVVAFWTRSGEREKIERLTWRRVATGAAFIALMVAMTTVVR